jgi:predicted N-acetyltransferase YhbS
MSLLAGGEQTESAIWLVTRPEDALAPDERAACAALWRVAFPPRVGQPQAEQHRSAPAMRFLLYGAGDHLLAAATLTPATIAVNDERVPIAALGGVATMPEQQRRGHGSRVVAAFAAYASGEYAWALLSCRPDHRLFYERLGWRVLAGACTVIMPAGDRSPLGYLMALPLGADAATRRDAWHTARIVLPPGEW